MDYKMLNPDDVWERLEDGIELVVVILGCFDSYNASVKSSNRYTVGQIQTLLKHSDLVVFFEKKKKGA